MMAPSVAAALRHGRDRLVADIVPVEIVDALEVIDVEHHRRQPALLRARFLGHFEKDAPVVQTGERIDRSKPHQLALHAAEPLGSAQSRVQFVRNRRLGDEIVSAAVERLAEQALVAARRHQDHVDRPVAAGENAGLPAELQAGHAVEFDRGDERRDVAVLAHAGKRVMAVAKRQNLVIARLKQARHE